MAHGARVVDEDKPEDVNKLLNLEGLLGMWCFNICISNMMIITDDDGMNFVS